jgi:gliding motility-associated-like protein
MPTIGHIHLFNFSMKNIFLSLFIFIILNNNSILGQMNLVPNPSFEDLSECPNDLASDVDLAIPWINAIATPDIYNPCSSVIYASAPLQNTICYQMAKTGVGYAGLISHTTPPASITEYMEVKLMDKLKTNKQYFIRFYISPKICPGWDPCYSDAIGLAFSDTLYKKDVNMGPELIPPFAPAIQNPSGNILTDTLNWAAISGCYTAKGTEQYAIIGNFRTSANTQNQGCVGATGTYLYIDEVGVYEYDPLPDTIILCSGESSTIGKSFLNGTYLWNTGEVDSILIVDKEGKYILNTMLGNCLLSDTVVVLEMDKLLNALPSDTLLCKGEVLEIDMPTIGNYLWSDGNASNQASISEGGMYNFSIENGCGVFTHSFEVTSEICECNVAVPNAFSPNNDGNNDFLRCYLDCDFPYQSTKFQVFNRWGNLVYWSNSTDNQEISWDGTCKGRTLGIDVYCWVLEYEFTRNSVLHKKTLSGNVSIIK